MSVAKSSALHASDSKANVESAIDAVDLAVVGKFCTSELLGILRAIAGLCREGDAIFVLANGGCDLAKGWHGAFTFEHAQMEKLLAVARRNCHE